MTENVKADQIAWVKSIMNRLDWTGTDLAREAGLAPSTVLRLLNSPDYSFLFSPRTLNKIAEAAGSSVPAKLKGRRLPVRTSPKTSLPGPSKSESRLLEVRVVTAFPKTQASSKPIKAEYVPAPPQIEDDQEAFAFRNPDEGLGALFKAGCLMFATHARDPHGGDLVMLTGKDGRTKVRLLLMIDDDGLRLSKTLPSKEDERALFEDIREVAVITMALLA